MSHFDAAIPSNGQSPLDALNWYSWDTEKSETSWLLTYVDVLSIILVVMVVLLGHTAIMQTELVETEPDKRLAVPVEPAKVTAPAKPKTVTRPLRIPPPLTIELPEDSASQPRFLTTAVSEPVTEIVEPPLATPAAPRETMTDLLATTALLDLQSPMWLPTPVATPAALDEPLAPSAVAEAPVDSAQTRLVNAIENTLGNEVKIIPQERGVSLEIAEVILFDSGKAKLKPHATPVLQQIAMSLKETVNAEISIEGHTDNRPIHRGRFASNWELAAARANQVTHFLLNAGLDADRVRSISYGDAKPIADNATAAGRAANRRVNLRVDFL